MMEWREGREVLEQLRAAMHEDNPFRSVARVLSRTKDPIAWEYAEHSGACPLDWREVDLNDWMFSPPGAFALTRTLSSYAGREDEEHPTVDAGAIWVSRKMVTFGQWQELMGDEPEIPESPEGAPVLNKIHPLWPRVCLSWFDTIRYCDKFSLKSGLEPAYQWDRMGEPLEEQPEPEVKLVEGTTGFRLPTLAEWAMMAGPMADEENLKSQVWFLNNSEETLHPVGMMPPNDIGLFDVWGNAWEWCWDQGPLSEYRYCCGGGFRAHGQIFGNPDSYLYAHETAINRQIDDGFRVVRTAPWRVDG